MDFKSLLNKFTIYQYMSVFLVILALASAFFYGFGINALIPVLISVLTTTILDFAIGYFKFRTFEFPYSALISGLFIGGLLTQNLQWHVYVLAGAIAILSKHAIKVHGRHIFNPANFGVLIVFLVFNAPNSWWISSPFYLVVLSGLFVLWRQRRFDLAVSFLAAYYILSSFVPQPVMMEHMRMMMGDFYQSFISQSTLFFFAMFMLIEPKTHPAGRKQRIFYGVLAAAMLIGIETYNPRFGLPFVLAAANLIVPLLNRLDFRLKKSSANISK